MLAQLRQYLPKSQQARSGRKHPRDSHFSPPRTYLIQRREHQQAQRAVDAKHRHRQHGAAHKIVGVCYDGLVYAVSFAKYLRSERTTCARVRLSAGPLLRPS